MISLATSRLLFLCADPDLVEAQLAGRSLARNEAGTLRDEISTDEITPLPSLVHFDHRLGLDAHTGFKAGERLPIGKGALKSGGFSVLAAGRRYGKGSSREHSPAAEREAGIRLVIAESFERLYRQNCDNIGLFTSTDLSLIDRLLAGEEIGIETLLAGREALSADILRQGGLLRWGQARMAQARPVALPSRPMTLAEKIIARHAIDLDAAPWRDERGVNVFVRPDLRFIHDIYTAMASHMLNSTFGNSLKLHAPESIICFEDHYSYVHRSPTHVAQGLLGDVALLSQVHREFVRRHRLRDHGNLNGEAGSQGISHALMAENYVLPGQLIAGTDSHTPHSGALGCLAYGVGTTEICNSFVTGATRIAMPQFLRIVLEGTPPPGITAKDIVLHLLAQPAIRRGIGVGKVFEFTGPAIAALSIDERATLTNMTAELGGLTGIVAPDDETVRFLRERRGVDFVIADWMTSDPDAEYAETIALDCAALTPMVAAPGDPGNGLPLADLTERPRIDIAYGGSCTAGKREDFDDYHEVLAWAAARGLKVAKGVTLYLQFGTQAVREHCLAQGYLDAFRSVGAEILQPACGACAQCGPGVSTRAEQVTVSAINRNFPGRTGPGSVWLASPPTVAASAIAGELVSFAELQARFRP